MRGQERQEGMLPPEGQEHRNEQRPMGPPASLRDNLRHQDLTVRFLAINSNHLNLCRKFSNSRKER